MCFRNIFQTVANGRRSNLVKLRMSELYLTHLDVIIQILQFQITRICNLIGLLKPKIIVNNCRITYYYCVIYRLDQLILHFLFMCISLKINSYRLKLYISSKNTYSLINAKQTNNILLLFLLIIRYDSFYETNSNI